MVKINFSLFNVIFLIGVIVTNLNRKLISQLINFNIIDHESFMLLANIVPFLSLLLLIGGSILLTLTYVSWRKYKGTKLNDKAKKRRSNN